MQLATRTLSGSPGPRLLIIAGVHGDEFEPMVAVRRLWSELRSQPIRGEVMLVPVVNEPAFLRGQRTTDDGLDLARTMPGRTDGSITQRIAAALTPWIQQSHALIDLHTGGRLFRILPLTGYVLHPDRRVLEQQRAMARAFNLPIVWGTSPHLDGRTLSVARDAHVPAIYVEACGGAEFQADAVEACVNGCLNVSALLGMIDRPLPPPQIAHFVEDHRDASGHLQIQHPAPADGFFEPTVQLGHAIELGDSLGRVVGPFGDVLGEVPAGDSGILLFQRAIPSVTAGESVGGILPIRDHRYLHKSRRDDISVAWGVSPRAASDTLPSPGGATQSDAAPSGA